MSSEHADIAAAVMLQIPPEPQHVALARMIAGAVAERQGFPEERVAAIRLLVSEACTNAVRAQRERGVDDPITLWCREDGRFRVEVVDASGIFFDGSVIRNFPDVFAGEGEYGGYGVPLMHHIADDIAFIKGDNGTVVCLDIHLR